MYKLLLLFLTALLGALAALLTTTAILGREHTLAVVFGPVELTAVDFRTLTRTSRPNQYLSCPANVCAASTDAVSPVYDLPVSVLKQRWLAMIGQQPRVAQLAVSADELQYDFIQRSQLLRFPDTITVRFIPLSATQSTLAIYSRSHYGYSDLGVNRKRIESWLQALQPVA